MAPPIDIRPAAEGDRDAVLRLLLAQLREHAIATPDDDVAAGVDGVLLRPQRGRFLLARTGSGEAIGLAALSFLWSFEHGGRAAWLDELYVVPELRGRGTGAALVRAACAVARESGARAVDLEVDAGHRRAAGLYAREGFRRHDRERWFKPLEPIASAPRGDGPPYPGRCLCGAVRYVSTVRPRETAHCHCGSCRRAAGAPVVTWATFPAAAFSFTAGTPREVRSSPHVVRTFCGDCGSPLTYREQARPAEVDVTVATLDRPESISPDRHIWSAERIDWLRLDDDLPHHPADVQPAAARRS